MSSLIDEIASYISIPGVPWESMEAQVGLPREELVYDVSSTKGRLLYVTYINDTFNKLDEAFKGIVMTFQVENNPFTEEDEKVLAWKAWKQLNKDVNYAGPAVLAALRSNVEFLSSEEALKMDIEVLRASVSTAYLVCLYGTVAHLQAVMQLNWVAPEDIVESADYIVKTMNGLLKLLELGVLDSLKRQAVGVAPAVWISVAAVVAVSIIAYTIYAMNQQSSINNAISKLCAEAVTKEDKERCAALIKINAAGTNPLKAAGDAVISIGQAAMMIAGAYFVIAVGVPILRRWVKYKEAEDDGYMLPETP